MKEKLNILLVQDEFFAPNNGYSISTQRFAAELKKLGHSVRVVSNAIHGAPDYPMPPVKLPVFDELVKRQGMTFARPDEALIREAVAWADVVHLEDSFALSYTAARIAAEMGKPVTGTFHMFPENITSSIHLSHAQLLNRLIYFGFRTATFRFCSDIHCPSAVIAHELKKNGYTARLHVISNGITPEFCYRREDKPEAFGGKFTVLCIGRYSREKRQDVLIDAMKYTRHPGEIQLIFAGQGPLLEKYRHRARKLDPPAIFKFYGRAELARVIAQCDLYVHTAEVEVEGMSCMEAFASGLTPVISDSKKTATQEFAIDERSLFRANDPRDLAKKIDYWMEHGDELARMGVEYSRRARDYEISRSALRLSEMLLLAYSENERKQAG